MGRFEHEFAIVFFVSIDDRRSITDGIMWYTDCTKAKLGIRSDGSAAVIYILERSSEPQIELSYRTDRILESEITHYMKFEATC